MDEAVALHQRHALRPGLDGLLEGARHGASPSGSASGMTAVNGVITFAGVPVAAVRRRRRLGLRPDPRPRRAQGVQLRQRDRAAAVQAAARADVVRPDREGRAADGQADRDAARTWIDPPEVAPRPSTSSPHPTDRRGGSEMIRIPGICAASTLREAGICAASATAVELADDRVDDRDQVAAGGRGDPALALVRRAAPRDLLDERELVGAVAAARRPARAGRAGRRGRR